MLLQDALPVLIDLQLRATKQSPQAVGKVCRKERQPDAADAHFSREYMDVVVGEVQQVLRKADMDAAAQQAQALMCGSALTSSDDAASRPPQARLFVYGDVLGSVSQTLLLDQVSLTYTKHCQVSMIQESNAHSGICF